MDVGTGAGSVIDSQRNCGVQCQIAAATIAAEHLSHMLHAL
jgi:hypothetical protein